MLSTARWLDCAAHGSAVAFVALRTAFERDDFGRVGSWRTPFGPRLDAWVFRLGLAIIVIVGSTVRCRTANIVEVAKLFVRERTLLSSYYLVPLYVAFSAVPKHPTPGIKGQSHSARAPQRLETVFYVAIRDAAPPCQRSFSRDSYQLGTTKYRWR